MNFIIEIFDVLILLFFLKHQTEGRWYYTSQFRFSRLTSEQANTFLSIAGIIDQLVLDMLLGIGLANTKAFIVLAFMGQKH